MQIKQAQVSRKEFIKDFVRLFKDEVDEVSNRGYQEFLLPPGSTSLQEFLTKCNKCYNCISDCPNESIMVSHNINSIVNEYPVIIPQITPCYYCTDFPCINACETGALTMDNCNKPLGTIKIIEENCFAFQGHYCSSCVNSCPKTGAAICSDELGHPVINNEECDGCGICINVCPSETPAIRILEERN